MTAPSNANTSGLVNVGHIVWWKAGGVSYYPEGEAFGVSKSCRVEPLVTAASAQARIAELSVSMTQQSDQWSERLLVMADRATAAEARADRLKADKLAIISLIEGACKLPPQSAVNTLREASRLARAALQQETQP